MVKLTDEQKAMLEALRNIPDDEIDFSDIPEITDWSGFRMGLFYRPKWTDVSLKLDESITDWFMGGIEDGETVDDAINKTLSSEMYRIKFPVRVRKVEELVHQIKGDPDKIAHLTGWQMDQIKAMYNMPAEEVAFSTLPLKPAGQSKLKINASPNTVNKNITLRLDENTIDWFEYELVGGQSLDEVLNNALMDHINRFQNSTKETRPEEAVSQSE